MQAASGHKHGVVSCPVIPDSCTTSDCNLVNCNLAAPFVTRPQGDYDRHLAKVSYAMDRKSAMLDSLLRRASLHLLLLLLGNEELRRLAALSAELQEAAGIMEGHVAATEARLQR